MNDTKTPETRPYPISLGMYPSGEAGSIELGIVFNGRSENEYLDYAKGFNDAPFFFYFDVRGDALVIICKWGFGRASRWAWGHCSPHDWSGRKAQLDGPIHPGEMRYLYVAMGGDKLKSYLRVLEFPAHYYNPLQKVLAELYSRPWSESGYYDELNAWVDSREARRQALLATGEDSTLEYYLSLNARHGGILHDAN